MGPDDLGSAIVRMAVACVLGGVVGWQRESHDRPAGFRTHILVCMGACLVMLVSIGASSPTITGQAASDPGRIAAQVVSGIGFLGAGTILRQGNIIRGLTTAASLWTVAAIGLAAGLGGSYLLLAGAATLLVLLTLTVFGYVEAHVISRRLVRELHLAVARSEVSEVIRALADRGITIGSVDTSHPDAHGVQRLHLILRVPPRTSQEDLTRGLIAIPGVQEVDWEGMPGT